MPIKVAIKQDFGDKVYLKIDNQQEAYVLVGIKIGPGHVCYHLSNGVEIFETFDFECSFERDDALRLSFDGDGE